MRARLITATVLSYALLATAEGAVQDAVTIAPVVQGHARGVALDAASNRFVAGFFFGEVDFNPGTGLDAKTSAGDADLFVTRFNANGSYAWTRTFGGTSADSAAAIAVLGETVFVAGTFASTDAGVANAGSSDAIVLAFDAITGEPRSDFGKDGVQTFGGVLEDEAAAIAVAGKTVYVCGFFSSANATIGGSGNFATTGADDAFVLALNARTGRPVPKFGRRGVQTLAGLNVERATGLVVAGRKLFVSGFLLADSSGIGGLGNLTGLGGLDAFVLALNRKTGRPRRTFGDSGIQIFGGTQNDLAFGIAAANGAVYATGAFESTNAGVGATGETESAGGFDAFVLALNATTGTAHPFFGIGGVQTFGGSEDDGGAAVAAVGDRLHVVGAFTSSDAGIGRSGTIATGGDGDAFVLQLDAFTGGAFDFAPATFGGSVDDAAFAIAVAGDSVFAAGTTFSWDAGLGGSGTIDPTGWNGFVLAREADAKDISSLTEFDTDGDEFPDEVEVALGTPPESFILSPAGFDAGPSGALTVRSLTIKLSFATPDPARDTVMLRGKVPIPAGFSPVGEPIAVSVGGVVRRFVLNASGMAATSEGSFNLTVRKTRGQVLAQMASFTAIFRRSSLRGQLDDEGLTGNATIAPPGETRSVAVIVLIRGGSFRADATVNYTAVVGQSGSAATP